MLDDEQVALRTQDKQQGAVAPSTPRQRLWAGCCQEKGRPQAPWNMAVKPASGAHHAWRRREKPTASTPQVSTRAKDIGSGTPLGAPYSMM
jgi:hypothetical protein